MTLKRIFRDRKQKVSKSQSSERWGSGSRVPASVVVPEPSKESRSRSQYAFQSHFYRKKKKNFITRRKVKIASVKFKFRDGVSTAHSLDRLCVSCLVTKKCCSPVSVVAIPIITFNFESLIRHLQAVLCILH